MMFLRLYTEFFRVGLFSVGGGLATIPFLRDMAQRTGWFTEAALIDMIAVSESTPGPIGVNMATYVGYECGGILGGIVATAGLVTPSILIILLVASVLDKFRKSRTVNAVFYGLRPASVALVTAAGISVAMTAFFVQGSQTLTLHVPAVLLAIVVFICTQIKWTKKVHPVFFILISAAIGIVFKF